LGGTPGHLLGHELRQQGRTVALLDEINQFVSDDPSLSIAEEKVTLICILNLRLGQLVLLRFSLRLAHLKHRHKLLVVELALVKLG